MMRFETYPDLRVELPGSSRRPSFEVLEVVRKMLSCSNLVNRCLDPPVIGPDFEAKHPALSPEVPAHSVDPKKCPEIVEK